MYTQQHSYIFSGAQEKLESVWRFLGASLTSRVSLTYGDTAHITKTTEINT